MINVHDDADLQKLNRFVKNISDKNDVNANYHNLYLIRKYDMSGHVIDEKYGMNLWTDHGLFRVNNTGSSSKTQFYLIFGTGNVTPDFTDITMTNLAFSVYPNITLSITRYPMKYDSETDLISEVCTFGSGTLDYNLSGVSSDVEVTHFGIYTNAESGQKLIIHSKVYDANGMESSFTKHPNEKVVITVYLKGCMLSKLITDAYDNGIYASFVGFHSTLLTLYDSSYIRMMYDNEQTAVGSYFYGYIPSGSSYKIPFGNGETVDASTHERTSVRSRQSGTSTLITHNAQYVSSLAVNWYGGLLLHADVKMSQPEEITCDCVYTEGNQSFEFMRPFGYPARRNNAQYNFNSSNRMDGCIPVNDFVITSSYMWDYSTKDWTIQEQFSNPDPGKYVFVPFFKSDNDLNGNTGYTAFDNRNSWKGASSLWINDADGIGVAVFIRTNKHTNIPIKKFMTDGTAMTVYGTNKYWDGSTYVKIPTYASDIPSECRNFKYYLFTQDISARAEYIYSDPNDVPHIVPTRQPFDIDIPELEIESSSFNGGLNLLASTTNGWIATFDHIVYPYAQGGPVVYSLIPYESNGPMKNHVLIDVENNINEVTWQSGRFDSTGALVADSYAWYTDQIFDITGYQHLCWQGTFTPTQNRGDRIIYYLYDADENFISLINSTDTTNISDGNLKNGIFDNLPDNVKYVRFGFWRKYGYGDPESPSVIQKLSYCELFLFKPALNKRYATKDRILMTNVYLCHGSETAYRPDSGNSNYPGKYSHCNILIAKVGSDPTVPPEFQLINFPFHVPYRHLTSSLMTSFDEYTGFYVISRSNTQWGSDVPMKIFGLDLYAIDNGTSNPSDNDAEMFYIGDGYGCKLCKKYKWCSYFDATNAHIIHAYDLENRTEICTFTIDNTYTIDVYSQVYNIGHYIYVPCKNGSKETVILCDIESQRWEEVDTFTSPTLYNISYRNFNSINNGYYWNDDSALSLNFDPCWAGYATNGFTDGDMISLTCYYYYDGNFVYNGTITSDEPRKWNKSIRTTTYVSKSQTYVAAPCGVDNDNTITSGVTRLILTDDGKHLLGIGRISNPVLSNSYAVFDVGMYMNNGQSYRYGDETEPYYYIQQPAFRTAPLENSVITYFDDGIIAYAPGKFRWSPLSCWLPHKVTGTTYTIQSYNNPKNISGGSITMKISNRIPTLPI